MLLTMQNKRVHVLGKQISGTCTILMLRMDIKSKAFFHLSTHISIWPLNGYLHYRLYDIHHYQVSHLPLEKMAAISLTIASNAFS